MLNGKDIIQIGPRHGTYGYCCGFAHGWHDMKTAALCKWFSERVLIDSVLIICIMTKFLR